MAVYGVLLPLPFDDVFDYTAEEELVLGQLVEVPFGREELVGVVWKKGQSADIDPKKIKQIKSVVQLPRLTAEMTTFIRKTAEYNLAPLGMLRGGRRVHGPRRGGRSAPLCRGRRPLPPDVPSGQRAYLSGHQHGPGYGSGRVVRPAGPGRYS